MKNKKYTSKKSLNFDGTHKIVNYFTVNVLLLSNTMVTYTAVFLCHIIRVQKWITISIFHLHSRLTSRKIADRYIYLSRRTHYILTYC